MLSKTSLAGAVAVALAAVSVTAAPARADLPVSVQAGAQFPLQDNARNAGGSAQTQLGLNYDFLRLPVVPVAVSVQLDDAFGSNGTGSLNRFGFGVAGRLTTPLYVGAGISVYGVNARLAYPNAPSNTGTAFGENLFAGARVFSLGGVGFALQASYEHVPSVAGIDPSAVGVGLRVQL